MPKLSPHKITSSLLLYLSVALFIFIPLYPKFPLFFVGGSTVAIRAEDFILGVSAAVLAIHYLLTHQKLTKIPLFFQIAVYLSIGLLSTLSAIFLTQTVATSTSLLHLFRRGEYFLGFFIIYSVTKEYKRALPFFTNILILGSVIVFAYAIAQMYFNAPVISTMNSEFSKGLALRLQPGVPISSTFSGHYDLAIYLVFILCLLASIFATHKKNLIKVSVGILFIALIWLLFQTGARITAGAALISIPAVLIASRKYYLIPIFLTIYILGAFTSPNLIARFGSLLNVVRAKFNISNVITSSVYAQEKTTPTPPKEELRPEQLDRSSSIRFDVEWPRSLRALTKNPFLGTGFSSITLATDNDYLRALGETGVLGFLSLIAILIYIGKKTTLNLKTKNYLNHSFAGIFITMVLVAVFLDVFEASKIALLFWMITGLFMAKNS
jgi:hypothetical protein